MTLAINGATGPQGPVAGGTRVEPILPCPVQRGGAATNSEREAFNRLDLLGELPPNSLFSPGKAKDGFYTAKLKEVLPNHPISDSDGKATPEKLSFEDRWSLLEKHADELIKKDWLTIKAVSALASKAGELGLRQLSASQLSQLLEAAQRNARARSKPIEPGGIFTIKATCWALIGLLRHGLNLLVGQPGAGKSRFSAAMMAAWLRGDPSFLGKAIECDLPVDQRHALIIGTDQSLEDWSLTLEPVGLAKKVNRINVRIHPRLTLYPLESGIQLDSSGLAIIRRWVDAHPGGMVLIDSLSQALPAGIDENKPEAGQIVHRLQEALGEAWGILTHHTRKGAGKDGTLGIGAGRGSGAIDGAVSRVVGLGLIHKMENGIWTPQEADPRRELLSTKRGGKEEHLIIRSDHTGQWLCDGTAEELKRAERAERVIANLTDLQDQILTALARNGSHGSQWLSGRQVTEALLPVGETYAGAGAAAAAHRKTLKRLEELGLVEKNHQGQACFWRAKQPYASEKQMTGSTGSIAAAQGISLARISALAGSDRLSTAESQSEPHANRSEPPCEPVRTQSTTDASHASHLPDCASEPQQGISLARIGGGASESSPPPWLPAVLELQRSKPDLLPAQLVNRPELGEWRGVPLTGRMVISALALFNSGKWPELRTPACSARAS